MTDMSKTNYVIYEWSASDLPKGVPVDSWTGHVREITFFTNCTLTKTDVSNLHWYTTHPPNEFPLSIAVLMLWIGLLITVTLIVKERDGIGET